jgi:hypothetical protein
MERRSWCRVLLIFVVLVGHGGDVDGGLLKIPKIKLKVCGFGDDDHDDGSKVVQRKLNFFIIYLFFSI